jgi:hypothetical protein
VVVETGGVADILVGDLDAGNTDTNTELGSKRKSPGALVGLEDVK